MQIPYQSLDPNTLNELIKDIVTRDGTDYGFEETSVEQRIASVKSALEQGHAYLFWDTNTESISLHSADQKPLNSVCD